MPGPLCLPDEDPSEAVAEPGEDAAEPAEDPGEPGTEAEDAGDAEAPESPTPRPLSWTTADEEADEAGLAVGAGVGMAAATGAAAWTTTPVAPDPEATEAALAALAARPEVTHRTT